MTFQGTQHLHLKDLLVAFLMLVSYFAYSSILKMEAKYSSETSVNFYRTLFLYILEDRTLHSRRCKNHKSNTCKVSVRMKYVTQKLLILLCTGQHFGPPLQRETRIIVHGLILFQSGNN
jgi:hypothetical protein